MLLIKEFKLSGYINFDNEKGEVVITRAKGDKYCFIDTNKHKVLFRYADLLNHCGKKIELNLKILGE